MGYSKRIKDNVIPATETMQAHLNRGEDGELMAEVSFKTEHGWTRPKVMTVDNWERFALNGDDILRMCDAIRQTEASVRKLEARKAEYDGHLANIERSRSIYGDEASAAAIVRVKAQYPDLFPVKAAPVEA